ncbi:MAG: response regulator [Anaerolineales bacterium]
MKETAPLQSTEHRELLHSLSAAADTLRALTPGKSIPAGEQAEHLKEAFQEAQYAANRLAELWMAARFDAGEFNPREDRMLIDDVVNQAVNDLAQKSKAKKVDLRAKLEDPPLVLGDPGLLQAMISNLLSGILGVSKKGSSVLISVFQRGGEVILKFEEQGDGISGELFPNLVHASHRRNTNQPPQKPVDVGTLMVKPIVDAHKGRLWIEGHGESGSALFLALPSAAEAPKAASTTGTKVLIVDDDPDGAFMLEQALIKGGYETEVAHDGLSGLAKARAQDIGLVLLDVMLPGIDGFEVCNRLRSEPATADLPIVMISAKSRPEDRETGLKLGANDYLSKPLRLAEVLEKTNELIRK